jgi:outer membrane lipoprotein-sorting protein
MVLLFLSAEWVQGQENPSRYLDSIERKYSGLKDYTADVHVHFDIEALRAPDMQAKLYYKSPDKMKVESKGVFFFPKDAGYFNPSKFKPEDFVIQLLEHFTYEGRKAVRLQLTPKEMKRAPQRLVLTIDIDRNLILRINTLNAVGREITATVDYGKFEDFELPTHIELQFNLPQAEANETREFNPFGPKTKQVTGKVEITYSNYQVNSELSDEIFLETQRDF